MSFRLKTEGNPIWEGMRTATLTSKNPIPELRTRFLKSSWQTKGNKEVNLCYEMSGALHEEDISVLKDFGNSKGQDVELVIVYRPRFRYEPKELSTPKQIRKIRKHLRKIEKLLGELN